MKLKDIKTSALGLIKGRDAIEIIKIVSEKPNKVEIIGSVNKKSCDIDFKIDADFIPARFIFTGVILFELRSDDICGILSDEEFEMYLESESESALEEIENSKIVSDNIGLHGYNHLRHIIMSAYDYDVEIVCNSFELKI